MNVLNSHATLRLKHKLGPTDRLTLYGRRAQYSKEINDGVVLREVSGAKDRFAKFYTWDELGDLLRGVT